jgi:hypothetical protein
LAQGRLTYAGPAFLSLLAREKNVKIGGVDPRTLPCEEILVLPRGDSRIVFRAHGLDSFDDFNRRCPEPVPQMKLTKDGSVADTDDKNYQDAISSHGRRRLAYIIVYSLQPSQIEWDSVEMDKPATWENWEKDLRNGGLSQVECNRVMHLAMEANSLSEDKLVKARESFVRGMQAALVA